MRLRNLFEIGILALGLVSCNEIPADNDQRNAGYEYFQGEISTVLGDTASIKGRIIKVQSGEFPIFWYRDRRAGATHQFEFIILEDEYGDVHTLVYPFPKAVLERYANIKFRTVKNGKTDSNTLIKNYTYKYWTNEYDNIPIETEGIIVPGGISYR